MNQQEAEIEYQMRCQKQILFLQQKAKQIIQLNNLESSYENSIQIGSPTQLIKDGKYLNEHKDKKIYKDPRKMIASEEGKNTYSSQHKKNVKKNEQIKQKQNNQVMFSIRPQSSEGKRPISNSLTDRLNRMYEYGMIARQDKELLYNRMRQEKDQRVMETCTFTPKLTKKAQVLSIKNKNYLTIEDKTDIFMRRKQLLLERREADKLKKETKECTFTPKVNPKKHNLPSDLEASTVYDRQIEWQKRVQSKNQERQVEISKLYSLSRNISPKTYSAQRSPAPESNSDLVPRKSVHTSQSIKRLQSGTGFFQDQKISATFLTFLNYKYDYQKAQSQEDMEMPQTLMAKPYVNEHPSENIHYQPHQKQDEFRARMVEPRNELRFNGNTNRKQLRMNVKQQCEYPEMQERSPEEKLIAYVKQGINRGIIGQFNQLLNRSQPQSDSKRGVRNTVNFIGTSRMQDIVVENNQYILRNPQNGEIMQDFQAVKEQLASDAIKNFECHPKQNDEKSPLKLANQYGNYRSGLLEKAYTINREIKEIRTEQPYNQQ